MGDDDFEFALDPADGVPLIGHLPGNVVDGRVVMGEVFFEAGVLGAGVLRVGAHGT